MSSISLENVLPRNVEIVNRDDFVLSHCRGKKVLHVGAVDSEFLEDKIKKGSLFHFKLMSEAQPKDVVGIDIDQKGIEILRKHGVNNVVYGNVERLEEIDLNGEFDAIVAGEIIEHLSNPGLFLDGVKRFFSKNTEMIISTPNAFSCIRFSHVFRGKEIVHPDHKCWYSYVTLKNFIESYGFRTTSVLLYSYRDVKLIKSISLKLLLNKSILLRKILYRVNPFFADGLIFVVKLDEQYRN